MEKPKRKKPKAAKIDWRQLLVGAAIDFFVGFLLLVIDKMIR